MWSEHWSDEQMIAHLYGVGPEDRHLSDCSDCRSRLEAIEARGRSFRAIAGQTEDVPTDFLAAQRRAVYARLDEKRGWMQLRRRAPALAMLTLAVGIAVTYQRKPAEISDAELLQQVSQMAEDSTPRAVAPIEALFEE